MEWSGGPIYCKQSLASTRIGGFYMNDTRTDVGEMEGGEVGVVIDPLCSEVLKYEYIGTYRHPYRLGCGLVGAMSRRYLCTCLHEAWSISDAAVRSNS